MKLPSSSRDVAVSLESVLCTDELNRRPSRSPDYQAESRALAELGAALADSPRTILQKLVEVTLRICRAGSAGVSLLSKEDDGKTFYWPAVAGAWSPHVGGGTPRDFGPCGVVLDRNAMQLFTHPERYYPYLLPIAPPIEEALLIPFYVKGRAVGTVWVIAHDRRRKFDAEDLRLIISLGKFAAGAYQVLESLDALGHRGEALRASEKRFRSLVVATSLDIWTAEPDGQVVKDSVSWRGFTGQTFDEWKGWGWLDAIHPEDRERTATLWRQCVANEHPFQTEYRLRATDGSYRWTAVRAVPVPGSDGRVREWIGTNTDITERKQAEATSAFLAAVVQNSDDAIITKNLDGVITSWNRSAERLFGYREQEVLGRPVTILIPPDRLDEEPQILDRLRRGERVDHFETIRLRKDGGALDVSLTISPVKDAAGRIVGVSKTARDITDRKRAAALLQHQKEALEMVARQVPLFDVLDFLARAVESQSQEQMMAAIHLLNAAGTHFALAAAPSLPAAYLQATEGLAVDSRSGPCCEAVLLGKLVTVPDVAHDPRFPRFAELALPCGIRAGWSTPIFSSRGKAVGTFANYYREPRKPSPQDQQLLEIVTHTVALAIEHKQAEEELREADRRKTEFLAMLAHELRNPLAPTRNAVQILRRTGSDDRAVQSASEMLQRQVGHMVRLVDDLLDVSRISQGKIELRKEQIELTSVVNHAVEAVRPLCESRNLELTVTLPPQPIYLNADPTRLAQVVGNLLDNACKFTERGGRIQLTVECDGKQAVLRVQDSGIGIAEDQLSRIFETFAQVDTSLERSRDGLGLGLTLVKDLVEMHDGTVEAHSAGVGQGSEFVVSLPLSSGPLPPLPREPSGVKPVATARRRILVVDDNEDSAESLAMLLKLTGHEVHIAYDGLEAVEVAARFQPQVILLDIGLPKLNGYEAARRIREQEGDHRAVLVALTGWGQEEDRRRSEEAGFSVHMVKPVDFDALTKLLAELGAG